MTLSPVFRSPAAVRLLEEEGIWDRLTPAIASQARAVGAVQRDLEALLDPAFRSVPAPLPEDGRIVGPDALPFVQEYFFLILFRSLFESLGVPDERLEAYAELNFCIKGTITAADNIFDDQAKSLLPLDVGKGSRFLSILQLMCFERLIRRALDRGVRLGALPEGRSDAVLRGLLDGMAKIGRLEGSEESGVEEIPPPEEMVDRVHRVRGGALFTLAFVAPDMIEVDPVLARVRAARPAIARLGTAFQIVDDLTDFEFDVGRRSHNLLVARIHHRGSPDERARLGALLGGEPAEPGVVEGTFRASARAVLDLAYDEARASFHALSQLGFWFPVDLAHEVVHAIVGLDGVSRMAEIAAPASRARG